jgi:hypothetical protein
MPKEAPATTGQELGKAVADAVLELNESASRAFSKRGLQFAEALLNGIEIRAKGRGYKLYPNNDIFR